MADLEITISSPLFGRDPSELVTTSLEDGSPELVQLLVLLVTEKTPVLTGALASSYEGIPNQTHGDPDLAYVFPGESQQIDEYGRVYAPYVEGPALGLSTFTNPPRQMFARTATENLPEIEAWALARIQIALGMWTKP